MLSNMRNAQRGIIACLASQQGGVSKTSVVFQEYFELVFSILFGTFRKKNVKTFFSFEQFSIAYSLVVVTVYTFLLADKGEG